MENNNSLLAELANTTQVARENAQRARQNMKALKAALKLVVCEQERTRILTSLDLAERTTRDTNIEAIRAGAHERALRNGVLTAIQIARWRKQEAQNGRAARVRVS